MNRKISATLCLCLAALGLCAGLFAFPAQADNPNGATSLKDLQALGYGLGHVADLPDHPLCFYWVVMYGNGAPWTVIGEPDQTTGVCATDPAVVQQRIDALIAAYPPQTATTATVPSTTAATAPVTTTPTTTTDTAPAAPTVTVTVTDPTVQAQIDALNAKIDALTTKVDKLAAANTASWDAFKVAVDGGSSVSDAALAARSAAMNSLYGL